MDTVNWLGRVGRVTTGAVLAASAALLVSSPSGSYSLNEKANYLTPEAAQFIRPGLIIKVTGVEIASDGTVKARVKLMDSKNGPLDREGIQTPGAVSASLMIARIPKGGSQYVAYTTRPQTSPITGSTAVQAGADSGGRWDKVTDGEYVYTFGTKLPAGYDRTVTHTVGVWGSRDLSEFGLGVQYDDDVYHFVPDGSKVTVVRDVVRTATCNKCHYSMGFHGGSRRSMELCVLCHTPQTTDPDTGNSVDMAVMAHKIHMGSALPSVKAGGKYVIIGHQQSVNDYSKVVFPADPRNCGACHEPGAAQADNVYKPNRAACGACHDNVEFDTGKNHGNLPQVTDNQCSSCHVRQGELEFDLSIIGAHTIPTQSKSLPGVVFDILEIVDTAPGQKPTVVFSIKDKAGRPIKPSEMASLSLYFYGPNSDVVMNVREDARKADSSPDGRAWWTFNTPIPQNATGSWSIAIEGRRDAVLLPGTVKQQTVRDIGVNKQKAFSVDKSRPVARRTVVANEKCNACHGVLSFHGGNRNRVEQCVICHNTTATVGGPNGTGINLALFIHKIHMGDELTRPYTVGNWSPNSFGYPGWRTNCGACHVNGSENLPAPPGTTPITDGSAFINPAPTATSACLACHDSRVASSHALSNISAIGESCASCHGPNGDFSVSKVHAR